MQRERAADPAERAGAHPPTAADFRAEIGRRQIVTYRLAAVVGVNPSTLSAILNERRPLPPALAERIQAALAEDAG